MKDGRFKDITLPLEGFKDAIGIDVRTMRFLEMTYASLFSKWGYEEINVPIVERASSFSEEVIGGSPWPEWDKRGVFYLQLQNYKDSYSDLPVQEPALLVPEGTISVSRWLARSYNENNLSQPKKIFYIMPCFRNELTSKLSNTKGREFHQAGIEILGTNNVNADLEVLLIAYQGFIEVGVHNDDILVRIGSVSLFNAVCTETGMSESDVLIVKDLMDTIAESRAGKQPERLAPSIEKVTAIVQAYNPSAGVVAKWGKMTNTYVDTLDTSFESVIGYDADVKDLNYLASIVREQGLKCVIDPSVVRSHEYYTGIVYEIDIKTQDDGVLVEVAGGGRYNKLIGKFIGDGTQDISIPAVGFAYGLERVVAIRKQLNVAELRHEVKSIDIYHGESVADIVLIANEEKHHSKLLAVASSLRKDGNRVDVYVGEDKSDEYLNAYTANLGAEIQKV